MAEKNDQDFIAFCDELRTYLSENYHFLNKYISCLLYTSDAADE